MKYEDLTPENKELCERMVAEGRSFIIDQNGVVYDMKFFVELRENGK